ncbi:hypothetical protein [Streptomyces neyagawaensis]|uniref:hypothetical protein n=1 Tax=Streptomyces neyagawaensis TaxID=42238 RepID=UPI0006E3AEB1|nr:hypothetical protein [Streptomyces neyagawaensis]MCL6737740.1 hypothetical protein [Streptomyces neyagawaensis]MDE1687731.1 hypothetical protein [Streptomyces neyagawaensis]MDG5808492.1 hypothetical protein [Streptomyces ossamyceticus]
MPNRFPSLSGYGVGWSTRRRITVIVICLAVLLALAAAVALLTGGTGNSNSRSGAPSGTGTTASASARPTASAGAGTVARPPSSADPVAFAEAAAAMLWSYDTRSTSRAQQLAAMKAWLTAESKYADWTSIAAQVPDPVLWSRMADQDQYATATVDEAHYPSAFKQALADDPSAITEAYIYAVTVTGKQQITWTKGGAGAEGRSITLAVQCRPNTDCSLVSLAPRVVP